jgi:hypothetical protein
MGRDERGEIFSERRINLTGYLFKRESLIP